MNVLNSLNNDMFNFLNALIFPQQQEQHNEKKFEQCYPVDKYIANKIETYKKKDYNYKSKISHEEIIFLPKPECLCPSCGLIKSKKHFSLISNNNE